VIGRLKGGGKHCQICSTVNLVIAIRNTVENLARDWIC